MPRLIKRYGSRKLYDTQDSRYASLDEVAGWVREGQQVQVVDNRSGEDVTAVVLTQILSEEGRRGTGAFSTGFLHDLIRIGESALRAGEEAVESRLKQARAGASGLVQRSFDRLKPPADAREDAPRTLAGVRDEMDRLRRQLEALEASLNDLEPPGLDGREDPEPNT
ncbi:MAG: polyhydroxyalkanoate synthesis regulator DNA-binding domain-containing protein [Rubricoccaceae bacterium]|nr:polyhydroxyalkanoate synthesis regulator DNA-binding domain-containing protein [Rubricoccaceae bacterium]